MTRSRATAAPSDTLGAIFRSGLLLLALVPCQAQAAEQGGSPAARFLELLGAKGAADQRREAWQALKESGRPLPASVVRAVASARSRAWLALERFLRSSAVRQAAGALRKKISPHQAAVRSVVNGNAFSKAALDNASGPIRKALDEALGPVREMDGFKVLCGRVDELEDYAADCGLRLGWDAELGENLVRVLFVNLYAGSVRWRATLERNRAVGGWIDPGEAACVAALNAHRILIGLHPLQIDARLTIAAKKHSEEMVAKGYFSHQSPTPRWKNFVQRAAREHTRASGECIAAGTSSGVAAFRMWYYSQGHHRIMISNATHIGVGRCGNKWTLMVGNAPSKGATPSKMAYYVRERYRAGEDPARLLALAKWCASAGLLEQSADELRRLLAIEPNNDEAKRALPRLEAKGY